MEKSEAPNESYYDPTGPERARLYFGCFLTNLFFGKVLFFSYTQHSECSVC